MTARIWLLAALVASLPSVAFAQETSSSAPGPLGLGLIIGAPTGLALKARLSETSSVDGAVGLGVGADVHVHGDYLFEGLPVILRDPESGFTLDWYLGVGARMVLVDDDRDNNGNANGNGEDDLEFGPRAPIGLEMYFGSVRNMEVFVEIAIGLDLVDETGVTADGGVGFRWFF